MYPKADKMQAFLNQHNELHPAAPLTKCQLNHWEKKFNQDGINGLVDRRGGYNKGQSSIPKEVWDVFLNLWAKQSNPSANQCYRMVQQFFPTISLPHISAFNRELAKLDKPFKTLYREGEKAYDDKCMPYIPIDYSNMYSNQQWVADHHVLDVLVVSKDENGKEFVCRPWLSGWIDRKSRYVVGYVINTCSPNSNIVLNSFADACQNAGIPDEVLLDNGKDYKVYDLFNTDFNMSVANQMNIKVTNAIPYNAKAKPIERLFGTLESEYCKHLASYVGSDTKRRAKELKKKNEKLTKEVMPYDAFVEFISNMITDYNNSPHSGLDDKTPLEIYRASFTKTPRCVQDSDVLNLFLQRTSKPVTVGRNGIRIGKLKANFDDTNLFPYQGQKVFARYNTNNKDEDVSKVYVYTLEDEFICIANRVQASVLGSENASEVIKMNNKSRKERKNQTKAQLSKVEVPKIEEYVSKTASEADEFNIKDVMPAAILAPVKHKHAKAIKEEEARQAERALPEEKKVVNGRSSRDIDRAERNFYVNSINFGGR
jgi:hypothetical protein